MYYKLTALVINTDNSIIKRYAKNLSEFGYEIINCEANVAAMISALIDHKCDIVISSQDDIDVDDYIKLIEFLKDKPDRPLIVDISYKPSLKIEQIISVCTYIYRMAPVFEDKAILIFIERYENYSRMSTEKLYFLLKKKVLYDCKYIGLEPNMAGFQWIYESAFMILIHPIYRKNFSAGVYAILQNRYNVTYTQIEPSIRRCIAKLTANLDDFIKKYYFEIDEKDPFDFTTSEFITKVAENVSLCFSRNYSEYIRRNQNERNKLLREEYEIKINE
ncbi:MAG: hypothetical protein IJ740_20225 [Ruminococcus sp.]|nr:hypothetical protein [Ruminococcus sp.]MBR1753173.1 hypothetical protein [Ruminococcus sp.]